MNDKLPKIIITDDHEMFREAIKTLLEIEKIAIVLGIASNGIELLEILKNQKPDIILLDIDMPVMNGIEACKIVHQRYPEIKILTLSMFGEEKYYKEMINAGARGFVLKSSGKSELEKAIHEIYHGESYFSNELLRAIISKIGKYKHTEVFAENAIDLTSREKEIIQNLCLGLSTQEIADKLFLSAKTVENYRVKLLNKTGSKNSIGLVVFAIKNNLVKL
jgi:DNA-binding NarL/FixJ family response regulator